jgi:hypothetical protein
MVASEAIRLFRRSYARRDRHSWPLPSAAAPFLVKKRF